MNDKPFEQAQVELCRASPTSSGEVYRDSLASAAADMPELEMLRRATMPTWVGAAGMRDLAFCLCLWGERNGVIDDVFPLSAVKEDGGK